MKLPTRISKINDIEVIQLGESSITTENKSQENKKVGKRKPKKPRTKKKKYIKKPPKKPIPTKNAQKLENIGPIDEGDFGAGEGNVEIEGKTIDIGGIDYTTIYVKKLKSGKTVCSKVRSRYFNTQTAKYETKETKCT